MANVLLMQTENVRSFATQTISDLDDLETRIGNSANQVANLDWTAPGRDSYVYEFQQTAQTVRRLLEEGRELCRRADQESQRWEVMAGGLGGSNSSPTYSTRSSSLVDALYGKYERFGKVDDLRSMLVVGFGRMVIHNTKRAGVFAVHGGRWAKANILGLNQYTTTMKAKNYAQQLIKAGKVKVGLVGPGDVISFAADTGYDVYRHRDEGAGMMAASVGYNVAITAVSIGAATVIGGVVGSILFPGVGTAAGMALGRAIVTPLVDFAIDKATEIKVSSDGTTVEDWATQRIYEGGKYVVDQEVKSIQSAQQKVVRLSNWVQDTTH